MAAKVTVTHALSWVPASGDQISAKGTETFLQAGNAAIGKTQDFTGTTAAVDIGDVAGGKYFFVKNLATPSSAGGAPVNQTADDANTIYIDQVTPVVPADAPHTLPPGKTLAVFTTVDAWHIITGGNPVQAFVAAVEP